MFFVQIPEDYIALLDGCQKNDQAVEPSIPVLTIRINWYLKIWIFS